MSRQTISTNVRFNIWLAHNRICRYCSEPLSFGEADIDHVIPESLRADEIAYKETLTRLGLALDFDIHSYANLLPAHRRCNRAKSSKNWSRLPFYIQLASEASIKVESLIAASCVTETRDHMLAKLAHAIQSGLITPSDLLEPARPPDVLGLAKPLVFADGAESTIAPEQVDMFLDRPVLIGGHASFVADFGDNSGKRLSVRTCREYRAALSAGFYALTTVDIKFEGFLKVVNAVLATMESVRVPTLSFIDKPFKGVSDIDLIPISVLPALAPEEKEEIAAMPHTSLGELLERREIRILSISSREIALEWRNMGLLMRECLRADLNGDGIEDILCESYSWAIEGTFGFSWTSILSRLGPDEAFTMTTI
jgi:HNH endonuclease